MNVPTSVLGRPLRRLGRARRAIHAGVVLGVALGAMIVSASAASAAAAEAAAVADAESGSDSDPNPDPDPESDPDPDADADSGPDAIAPSLALQTDRARSHPRIALVVDPAAAVFGAYGPRAGFALGGHQALWLFPSVQTRDGARGAALEVAYAVMPLGRGLEGLRLGAVASAARFPGADAARIFRVGGEAGWAHLFGRFFLGGAAGAARRFADPREVDRPPWEVVVRVELGGVFL